MKNLNKKNANRLTKVEETFDVPEPVVILPLAESDGIIAGYNSYYDYY